MFSTDKPLHGCSHRHHDVTCTVPHVAVAWCLFPVTAAHTFALMGQTLYVHGSNNTISCVSTVTMNGHLQLELMHKCQWERGCLILTWTAVVVWNNRKCRLTSERRETLYPMIHSFLCVYDGVELEKTSIFYTFFKAGKICCVQNLDP